MTEENVSSRAARLFYYILILLLLAVSGLQAQEMEHAARNLAELPELDMTYLEDPGSVAQSPAVILYEGGYKYDTWSQTRFSLVRRIQIVTEVGLKWTEFNVQLKPYEYVENVKGRIIRANGQAEATAELQPVKQEVTFESPWGPELHQTYQVTGVEAGDVIEYQYTVSTQLGLGLRFNLWYMQDLIPTQKTIFTLDTPLKFMPFKAEVENIDLALWPAVEETEERKISSYKFVNIPALPDEPMMPPEKYVLGRMVVDYQWSRSYSGHPVGFWLQAGRNQATRLNRFLEDYRGIPEVVGGLIDKKMSINERTEVILEYVRTNIVNLALLPPGSITVEEFDEWEPAESAREVLELAEAGPMELAMLTIGMLREAGVNAYLAMAVDRQEGVLRHTFMDTRQFNHVFVAVKRLDNSALYLDPTVPSLRPGKVPWFIQGSLALVCTRQRSFFVRMLVDHPSENEVSLRFTMNRRDEQGLAGELAFEFTGQHTMQLIIEALQAQDEKRPLVFKNYLKSMLGQTRLQEVSLPPGWQNGSAEKISGRAKVQFISEETGQNPTIDLRDLVNHQSRVAISSSRILPVYFEFPRSVDVSCEITGLGSNNLDLPENHAIKSEVGEIHTSWKIEKNFIRWEKHFRQERIFFNPHEVLQYHRFVERVNELEKAQLARILSQ